ncbi:hypothetical protein BVI1335_830060 [Burkholderia vietnamiensis]|nr:hypothetical protein BVI1335_830060 [Burkholderia vietnamiensis]
MDDNGLLFKWLAIVTLHSMFVACLWR